MKHWDMLPVAFAGLAVFAAAIFLPNSYDGNFKPGKLNERCEVADDAFLYSQQCEPDDYASIYLEAIHFPI